MQKAYLTSYNLKVLTRWVELGIDYSLSSTLEVSLG